MLVTTDLLKYQDILIHNYQYLDDIFFVTNLIFGGENGYLLGKSIFKLNIPPANGLSIGPIIVAFHTYKFLGSIGLAEQLGGGEFFKFFSFSL